MSKLIPPLVSTTPPPIGINDVDDNEDDEFGDFSVAAEDTTYGCDSYSIPNTPESSPRKVPQLSSDFIEIPTDSPHVYESGFIKDFQDKRKSSSDEANDFPNGTMHNSVPTTNITKSTTNGHFTYIEENKSTIEALNDSIAEFEKPPELELNTQDDCKEEYSETPSNFSMSFDAQSDDEDDELELAMELPNHDEIIESCNTNADFGDELNEDIFIDTQVNDDEFGDFTNTVSDDSTPSSTHIQADENIDNLPPAAPQSNDSLVEELPQELEQNNQETQLNNESFIKCNMQLDHEDFDDFKNSVAESIISDTQNIQNADVEDEFDDFADFSTAAFQEVAQAPTLTSQDDSPEIQEDAEDDDFGDFDDYTTVEIPTTNAQAQMYQIPLLQPENVCEQAEDIFKLMFDPNETSSKENEYEYLDYTKVSDIFKEIKDVTETNALSYQWGKSVVQQGLLNALNIDTRNILYAHGIAMPKFASNLGMAPLEPVKSDILMPTPASTTSSIGQVTPSSDSTKPEDTAEIPAAKFDWSESGLANPLDSTFSIPISSELNNHVGGRESTAEKSNLALEDWDLWLQSISKEEESATKTKSASIESCSLDEQKFENVRDAPRVTYDTESVNSLQFPEMSADPEDIPKSHESDDFSDFTSFQSTMSMQPSTIIEAAVSWAPNMIPLRETYIDNVKTDWSPPEESSSIMHKKHTPPVEPEWLQPSILTPVFPHKTINPPDDDDDDFADFQDFKTHSDITAPAPVPVPNVPVKQEMPIAHVKAEETSNISAFGGNLLAPTVLQPTLLEPVKLTTVPQEIAWPDPGITDEELARFDLYARKDAKYTEPTFTAPASVTTPESTSKAPETKLSGPGGSLMVEKSVVVPANKVILPFNEVILPPNNQVVISKDLVLPILESSPRKYTPQRNTPDTEEDWSDFVSSVQQHNGSASNPPSHLSPSKDRTGTPELSLSIPQLSSIQPSKPPIPVITPHGLMQTKIPSVASNTPGKLHAQPPRDGYQPAIISTQFAAHLNQSSSVSEMLHNSHYQTTNIPAKLNGFHDDNDEWSDFMSSQPVGSDNSSLYNSATSSSGFAVNWNPNNGMCMDMPNIITNPVHFQSYPSVNAVNSLNRKPNGVLHSKTPQNLNPARLPELEFVAPKTKVNSKK